VRRGVDVEAGIAEWIYDARVDELRRALGQAAEAIAAYREGLGSARVAPAATRDEVAATLDR
jgi:hypothetical protein